MSEFSLAESQRRLAGRSDPARLLTIQCGRDTQKAVAIETGKYDIRLSVERALPPGTIIELKIRAGFPVEIKTVTGIVHWSLPHRTNPEVGIALTTTVPPDLLIATQGSIRTNPRYQCKINGTFSVAETGQATPATVINYSRNGLCLKSATKCDIGDSVIFQWSSLQDRMSTLQSRTVIAAVRWVSLVGDFFLVGCETSADRPWPVSEVDVLKQLPRTILT